jgi:hypothetical protein
MNQNKTTKYFKYAIGEIILVVIGILIALQINNWNENRKAQAEEQKILTVLFQEIKNAKVTCQAELDTELKNIKSYEKVLGDKENQKHILNHIKVDSLFFRLIWGVGENASEISAITEIQNSGNSTKIRSELIRRQITALSLQLKTLENIVKDRLTVQQLSIDKFSFEIENFRKLIVGNSPEYNINFGPENDYDSLLKNPKFINAIAIKLDLSGSVIRERKLLMVEINKLLELIKNEI